ncbi:hypothetical protein [Streptomyces sp. NPDC058268]|uniref:hypothetical protein n=1 Tax=Streptomyces sp. NPDC058268 TaxID=3346413 RepID=UPI0036EE24FC
MISTRQGLALVAAGLTVLASVFWGAYRLTDAAETTSAGEAVTLYDTRDARQIAGTADDVFAGTVGTLTVNYEQGAKALSAGQSYVFATGRVPDKRTHAILLETSPAPFTSLTAPVGSRAAGAVTAGQTVAGYRTWAVDHDVDLSSGR